MNCLHEPTNPSEAYRAQLAALIQLGMPMVEKVPHGVPITIGTRCALLDMTQAFLKLRIELLREEIASK
jgi:hypothetical protein